MPPSPADAVLQSPFLRQYMHPFFRNMRHRATVILTVLIACAIASLIFSGMIG